MSNSFITTDLVVREALLLLRNNLVATMLFDRRYEGSFSGEEKVGDTVRIRRRDEGEVSEFTSSITADTVVETNVSLTLEKHFDASFSVTSRELTLDIQDFSAQVLAPRILKLAEYVDAYCLGKLHHLPNIGAVDAFIGTGADVPDALPDSIADLAQVRKTLNELKVPLTGRVQICSPDYEATLLSTENFMTADKRGDGGSALEAASIGRVMGFDYYMGQAVDSASFTSGTFTTGAVVNNHSKGATQIAIDGSVGGTDTLKIGDILNIAGYGNVVIAANVTFSANAGTITIIEPLAADIVNNAVVTKFGASAEVFQRHGAAFHPRAFAFASVPLVVPPEAEGTTLSFEGLSIRAIRQYDITTKKSIMSLDCLVGAAMVDGRLGVQIIKEV